MLSVLFQLMAVLAIVLCLLPKKAVLSIRNWMLNGWLKDSLFGLFLAKLLGLVDKKSTKLKEEEE